MKRASLITTTLRVSFIIISTFCLSGCVYSFKGSGGVLVESISVAQLENKTNQAGVADRLTELMVDALVEDGRIKVLPQSSAESSLSGALTKYERRAFESTETDEVSRYEIVLTVTLTLSKTESGEEIWSASFSNSGVYNALDESEEDGQARAADLIVLEIMNKTTRSW